MESPIEGEHDGCLLLLGVGWYLLLIEAVDGKRIALWWWHLGPLIVVLGSLVFPGNLMMCLRPWVLVIGGHGGVTIVPVFMGCHRLSIEGEDTRGIGMPLCLEFLMYSIEGANSDIGMTFSLGFLMCIIEGANGVVMVGLGLCLCPMIYIKVGDIKGIGMILSLGYLMSIIEGRRRVVIPVEDSDLPLGRLILVRRVERALGPLYHGRYLRLMVGIVRIAIKGLWGIIVLRLIEQVDCWRWSLGHSHDMRVLSHRGIYDDIRCHGSDGERDW